MFTAKYISNKYGVPVKEVSRRARRRGVVGIKPNRVLEYTETDMYTIIIPAVAYSSTEPVQPINAQRNQSLSARPDTQERLERTYNAIPSSLCKP